MKKDEEGLGRSQKDHFLFFPSFSFFPLFVLILPVSPSLSPVDVSDAWTKTWTPDCRRCLLVIARTLFEKQISINDSFGYVDSIEEALSVFVDMIQDIDWYFSILQLIRIDFGFYFGAELIPIHGDRELIKRSTFDQTKAIVCVSRFQSYEKSREKNM
jgi:hypothetical protein